MTSNIGLREFTDHASIGFSLDENEQTDDYQRLNDFIKKSLKTQFRPEFLNRLDSIVTFRPLTKSVARKIVLREIEDVQHRLSDRKQKLRLGTPVVQEILSRFKPQEGARSLKRAVQDLIVNPLANKLLNEGKKSTISATVKDKEIVFK